MASKTRKINRKSLSYVTGSKTKGYTYEVEGIEYEGATTRRFAFEGAGATRDVACSAAMAAAEEWVKEVVGPA